MRRYWIVKPHIRGFEMLMLVYGTEQEMWAYMNSEIGGGDDRHTGNYGYTGATDTERATLVKMGVKAYLAPEI